MNSWTSANSNICVLDVVISIAQLEGNVKRIFENKLSKEERLYLLSNLQHRELIESNNCVLTEEEINFINLNDL